MSFPCPSTNKTNTTPPKTVNKRTPSCSRVLFSCSILTCFTAGTPASRHLCPLVRSEHSWRSTRTHDKNVRQVRLVHLSSPSSITQITRRVSFMGSLSSVTFGLGFRIDIRSAVWLVLEFDQSSTHTPTTPTYHAFFSLRFQTQTGVEKRNPTNPPLILFYLSKHPLA